MRGNIEKRGEDHRQLRVFAGRQGGKTKFVTRNFQGSKRQAETALAKLLAEVQQGQVADNHAITVADLVHRWLADIREAGPRAQLARRSVAVASQCSHSEVQGTAVPAVPLLCTWSSALGIRNGR
ncbi:MAG TPA: hypothetical protein VFN61_05000 [Acidimicrobiales bacterium]|nr:hypothetical protein [Acidimicrobiales bacterium]